MVAASSRLGTIVCPGRQPDGYLVGNHFTVADLAAAALLAPAVVPPEFPYQPPLPMAPAFTRWLARWNAHPGAAWVRAMYARHRGSSAETAASRAP